MWNLVAVGSAKIFAGLPAVNLSLDQQQEPTKRHQEIIQNTLHTSFNPPLANILDGDVDRLMELLASCPYVIQVYYIRSITQPSTALTICLIPLFIYLFIFFVL